MSEADATAAVNGVLNRYGYRASPEAIDAVILAVRGQIAGEIMSEKVKFGHAEHRDLYNRAIETAVRVARGDFDVQPAT